MTSAYITKSYNLGTQKGNETLNSSGQGSVISDQKRHCETIGLLLNRAMPIHVKT